MRKMEVVAVRGDRVTANAGGCGGTQSEFVFQEVLTLVHTERVQLMGWLGSRLALLGSIVILVCSLLSSPGLPSVAAVPEPRPNQCRGDRQGPPDHWLSQHCQF